MTRTIIAYSINAAILFAALFATFAMAGLGRINVPEPIRSDATATEASLPAEPEPQEEPEPSPLAPKLDYPDLEWGRLHRLSHQTTIYGEPSIESSRTQTIPENGFFIVEASEKTNGELWYNVTVNDGLRDYSMYLRAKDLNWKIVRPVYSRAEREAQRDANKPTTEEILAGLRERLGGRPPEPEPAPPPPEPNELETEWARFLDRLGSRRTANIIVSGAAAFGLTALVMGSFALIAWLRQTHRWEQLPDADEKSSRSGDEFYDYDHPQSPPAEDEDPDNPFA